MKINSDIAWKIENLIVIKALDGVFTSVYACIFSLDPLVE